MDYLKPALLRVTQFLQLTEAALLIHFKSIEMFQLNSSASPVFWVEVFIGCFFASCDWIEIYLRTFDKLFLTSTLTRDYSFNLLNGKFDFKLFNKGATFFVSLTVL